AGVDTAQVCLSKGLGAPVGSLVCGEPEAMRAARRLRKMLGGGVRQAGVLGAAGLVALEDLPRLPEDHARARALAAGLRALGFAVDEPETNIVRAPVPSVAQALDALRAAKVLATPSGDAVRFVAHRDVGDHDIAEALARIAKVAEPILTF